MRIILKILGWLFIAIGVLGGGLQLFARPGISSLIAMLFWIALGYYCLRDKKEHLKDFVDTSEYEVKHEEIINQRNKPSQGPGLAMAGRTTVPHDEMEQLLTAKNDFTKNDTLFTRNEILDFVSTCEHLALMFQKSVALLSSGEGRADRMSQTMQSYICIFIYLYEHVLHYGKATELLKTHTIRAKYGLSYNMVFSNEQAMRQCLSQLPVKWQDVINVLDVMNIAGEDIYQRVPASDIAKLTSAFKKLAENHNSL